MHKRNTEGLAKAAKKRRELTLSKVNEAINYLIKKNEPINFNSVSKTAKVGKPWLYRETSVYQKIISLRSQSPIKTSEKLPSTEKASEKSKDHIINMLKDRIKTVETENKKLKSQIEKLYGELYTPKHIEKEISHEFVKDKIS